MKWFKPKIITRYKSTPLYREAREAVVVYNAAVDFYNKAIKNVEALNIELYEKSTGFSISLYEREPAGKFHITYDLIEDD